MGHDLVILEVPMTQVRKGDLVLKFQWRLRLEDYLRTWHAPSYRNMRFDVICDWVESESEISWEDRGTLGECCQSCRASRYEVTQIYPDRSHFVVKYSNEHSEIRGSDVVDNTSHHFKIRRRPPQYANQESANKLREYLEKLL